MYWYFAVLVLLRLANQAVPWANEDLHVVSQHQVQNVEG